LRNGGAGLVKNDNPNAVVVSFSNSSGNITAGVYNVTSLILSFYSGLISVTEIPTTIVDFRCGYTTLTTLPPLSGTQLDYLYCSNSSLTTLPPLPSTLTRIEVDYCSLSTTELDDAVTDFLIGTLPKNYWVSNNNPNQPSAPKQALLSNTANVLSATYTP